MAKMANIQDSGDGVSGMLSAHATCAEYGINVGIDSLRTTDHRVYGRPTMERGEPFTLASSEVRDVRKFICGLDLFQQQDNTLVPDLDGIQRTTQGSFFRDWALDVHGIVADVEIIADTLALLSSAIEEQCAYMEINFEDFYIYRKSIVYAAVCLRDNDLQNAVACICSAMSEPTFARAEKMMTATCATDEFCEAHKTKTVSFFISDSVGFQQDIPTKRSIAESPRYIALVDVRSENKLDWIKAATSALGPERSKYDVWYHDDDDYLFQHVNVAPKASEFLTRIAVGKEQVSVPYVVNEWLVDMMARVRALHNGRRFGNSLMLEHATFGPQPPSVVQSALARVNNVTLNRIWYFGAMLVFDPSPVVFRSRNIHPNRNLTDAMVWGSLCRDVLYLLGNRCDIIYDVISRYYKFCGAPLVSRDYAYTGIKAPVASVRIEFGDTTRATPNDREVMMVHKCIKYDVPPILANDNIDGMVEHLNKLNRTGKLGDINLRHIDENWVRRNQFSQLIKKSLLHHHNM
jgi:hypothetical protein